MDGQWKIHKFGGSSLADAGCFERVATLLLDSDNARTGVVVSAMGGMTDALLRLATLAEQNDDAFVAALTEIGARYSETAQALLDGDRLVQILDNWGTDSEELRNALETIAAARSAPQRSPMTPMCHRLK